LLIFEKVVFVDHVELIGLLVLQQLLRLLVADIYIGTSITTCCEAGYVVPEVYSIPRACRGARIRVSLVLHNLEYAVFHPEL
jgi:hypothetical protein